jgi:enoyl-CoA hydratase/carnithine racemase
MDHCFCPYLLHVCVDRQEEVLPRALELARRIARNSPVAVRMTLKTLRSQQVIRIKGSHFVIVVHIH